MNLFKLAWPGAADDQEDAFDVDDRQRRADAALLHALADQGPEQQVITSARAWRGAGGGRGATSGMRLDTDTGRRELAVEQEVQRLAAINPASRERLRALAEFNLSQLAIEQKPVDREAQYTALDYAPSDAAANARFDASLEQRLNARSQKARPDAVTGERIVQRYNPNSERERVTAEEKEMRALRADARLRAAAQEMHSVMRGLAQGAGGLYATSMGAAGLAGELTGNEDLRDWGLEGYRETMRGVNNIRLAPTFTGIRDTGDAVEWALKNSGYAGFQAATTILSAGMGGMIANTVGKKALGEAVGIALNSTVQTFGSVYGEAVEESRRTGRQLDLPVMLAGATISTAIDTLADRIGLDALSAKTVKGNALERLGKSMGTQMAVQGGTEAAQRVPEELGAGRDPFREGAGAQYVDDLAAGALFGAHAGVVGGLRGGESKVASTGHGAQMSDVPVVEVQNTAPTSPTPANAAGLQVDMQTTGTLFVQGDPGIVGEALQQAGVAATDIFMGSQSVLVAPPSAERAREVLSNLSVALQGHPLQPASPASSPPRLHMALLDRGSLAITGDDPAAVISHLQRGGIDTDELIQIGDRVLVTPFSADAARRLLAEQGPSRTGAANAAAPGLEDSSKQPGDPLGSSTMQLGTRGELPSSDAEVRNPDAIADHSGRGFYGTLTDRLKIVKARAPEEIADRSRIAGLVAKARSQGDPGVPKLVSQLEGGGVRVKDANHYVGQPLREVDIETSNGTIVQVKRLSSARKIISQIQDTQTATGQPTIGFVVEKHRRANMIVQQAGKHVQVTNDFGILLKWLKEE